MKKGASLTWFLILALLAPACRAASPNDQSLEVIGKTYEITETNMMDLIMRRLKEKEKSGELKRLEQEAISRAKRSIESPAPVRGITTATESRTYHYDPSIITKESVVDHTGRIIVPAGTVINPFEYTNLSKHLVFIDARQAKQVDFAMEARKQYNGRVKIILTGGSYMELMRKHKFQIYYDQYGQLTERLGIRHVPAIVSQDGARFRISEVAL